MISSSLEIADWFSMTKASTIVYLNGCITMKLPVFNTEFLSSMQGGGFIVIWYFRMAVRRALSMAGSEVHVVHSDVTFHWRFCTITVYWLDLFLADIMLQINLVGFGIQCIECIPYSQFSIRDFAENTNVRAKLFVLNVHRFDYFHPYENIYYNCAIHNRRFSTIVPRDCETTCNNNALQ